MLSDPQKNYLKTISSDRVVEIVPFTKELKRTADSIIEDVKSVSSNIHVRLLGASGLGISGQGDLDMYILHPADQFRLYLPGLKKIFGKPEHEHLDNVEWKFKRDGIEVELYLTDPSSESMKEQIQMFEILDANKLLKKEYEKLKSGFNGKSFRDYQEAKYEFYNKIMENPPELPRPHSWTILFKREDLVFKAFKVEQHKNNDISIIPYSSLNLNRDFMDSAEIGDSLTVTTDPEGAKIDHFSAHSASGQRHIKFSQKEKATDVVIGDKFEDIDTVIPLASMVVTTAREQDGVPSKGKFFGYYLPEDVSDHCIVDLYAIPLNSSFNFNLNFNIKNEKMSKEVINTLNIPLRNATVVMILRTSDHNKCNLPYNVFVQQTVGKTAQIVRVSDSELEVQISELSLG